MSDINVHRPTASQRTAARVVGMTYLLTIPLAAIPEFYIPSRLYGPSSMETNRLIAANVALFRLGTASNLLVFTMAAAQICGLHLVLKPVRRGITLGATVLRIIETTLLLGIVVNDVGLARYLSDPAVFNAGAATRLSIAYHSDIYAVALFLSGLGSMLFAWLWLKSRYVPVPLAFLGGAGFALLAVREFLLIAAPETGRSIGMAIYGGPIFLFELGMGLWLLVVGLRG